MHPLRFPWSSSRLPWQLERTNLEQYHQQSVKATAAPNLGCKPSRIITLEICLDLVTVFLVATPSSPMGHRDGLLGTASRRSPVVHRAAAHEALP